MPNRRRIERVRKALPPNSFSIHPNDEHGAVPKARIREPEASACCGSFPAQSIQRHRPVRLASRISLPEEHRDTTPHQCSAFCCSFGPVAVGRVSVPTAEQRCDWACGRIYCTGPAAPVFGLYPCDSIRFCVGCGNWGCTSFALLLETAATDERTQYVAQDVTDAV